MNEREAIDWIHGHYAKGNKEGLRNTRELLRRLGDPQLAYPCIHVAGTNGKGSVCAMLERVLRVAGCKVGLYTSPYLECYNERMRVDGDPISGEELPQVAQEVRAHVEDMAQEDMRCTVFEIGTACAFLAFARAGVDVAVIEVGLGGRLDPTNVITPVLSVITHIGMDHTALLGKTIGAIALEKAGIVKPGIPCVLYPQGEDVRQVVAEVCRERGSALIGADAVRAQNVHSDARGSKVDFVVPQGMLRGLDIPLAGAHQVDNARTALAALLALRPMGWALPDEAIAKGFAQVRWPGRLEWIGNVLLDGAHNPQGAQALADFCRVFLPAQRMVMVCGILEKKDVRGIIEHVAGIDCQVIAPQIEELGFLPAQAVADEFQKNGKKIGVATDVNEAMTRARRAAGEDGVVLVCGSLYLVGMARTYVHQDK